MNRRYSGFTLIEMLIVMGIIIILMAVGIAAGRFAINRANDVAHQNAADQLFTAVTSHLTDFRDYPNLTNWAEAMDATAGARDTLGKYMTTGEFRGGTDATYYYWTDDSNQAALVCVSLGGHLDADARGFYCTGTGFGHDDVPGGISEKNLAGEVDVQYPGGTDVGLWDIAQNWINADSAFDTPIE
jgi:prepilin-type N-terminal cleavage/methylation domain-containing protein